MTIRKFFQKIYLRKLDYISNRKNMSLLKYWEALGVWGTKKSRQNDSDLELKQKKMFTPLTAKEIQNIKNLWGGG